MHKIFRIFIILFLALNATTVVGQSCYNQPTYASMGSTGGGGTSTGGGSSSGDPAAVVGRHQIQIVMRISLIYIVGE